VTGTKQKGKKIGFKDGFFFLSSCLGTEPKRLKTNRTQQGAEEEEEKLTTK
jgi:hypothetical protein